MMINPFASAQAVAYPSTYTNALPTWTCPTPGASPYATGFNPPPYATGFNPPVGPGNNGGCRKKKCCGPSKCSMKRLNKLLQKCQMQQPPLQGTQAGAYAQGQNGSYLSNAMNNFFSNMGLYQPQAFAQGQSPYQTNVNPLLNYALPSLIQASSPYQSDAYGDAGRTQNIFNIIYGDNNTLSNSEALKA